MSDDDEATISAREVRRAYRMALEARQQYRRAVGSDLEAWAHEELHQAVFDFYDVLRPLIKNANATEEHWSERQLWPIQHRYVAASVCPACGFEVAGHEHAAQGSVCGRCGDAQLRKGEAPAVDEDGNPLYVWVEGLEEVDDLRYQSEVVEHEYSDAMGTHTRTEVQKQLLDPRKLVTIADTLDECLEELGLLAETDDEVTTTELDQEDLDAFRERLGELKDEAGVELDDDGEVQAAGVAD